MQIPTLIEKDYLTDISRPDGSFDTRVSHFLTNLSAMSHYVPSSGPVSILWRGQKERYALSPSAHTRISRGAKLTDDLVIQYTREILAKARAFGLDKVGDARLPDMPLLALLQHNLVATPLLDVSADPTLSLLLALDEPSEPGMLAAIPSPSLDHTITEFDTRDFEDIYTEVVQSEEVWHYMAPYVTSRLRVQRGSFLLSGVADSPASTMRLDVRRNEGVLDVLDAARSRKPGRRKELLPHCTVLEIPAKMKSPLAEWVEAGPRLDKSYIYPEPLTSRFVDDFKAANGRNHDWQPLKDPSGVIPDARRSQERAAQVIN